MFKATTLHKIQMEDNYLYRCPRDLDKELKSFATATIVDVSVVETYIPPVYNEPEDPDSSYATIVIEITSPNGIINRYVIAKDAEKIRRFLDRNNQ